MINQHPQTLAVVQQALAELQDFIAVCRDARAVLSPTSGSFLILVILCQDRDVLR